MTITPSELQLMGDASDLLDGVCRAAGVFLTDTQKARALAELTIYLEAVQLRWKAEWLTDLLDREEP